MMRNKETRNTFEKPEMKLIRWCGGPWTYKVVYSSAGEDMGWLFGFGDTYREAVVDAMVQINCEVMG